MALTEAEQDAFDQQVEQEVFDALSHADLFEYIDDVDVERKTVTLRLTFDQVLSLKPAPNVITDPRLLALLEAHR